MHFLTFRENRNQPPTDVVDSLYFGYGELWVGEFELSNKTNYS